MKIIKPDTGNEIVEWTLCYLTKLDGFLQYISQISGALSYLKRRLFHVVFSFPARAAAILDWVRA